MNAPGDSGVIAPLAQVAVMAAVVATLLYFPLGIAAALGLGIAGIGIEALITFGGALGTFLGLAVWWLLMFAGALVYAACLFPWGDKVFVWPKKR